MSEYLKTLLSRFDVPGVLPSVHQCPPVVESSPAPWRAAGGWARNRMGRGVGNDEVSGSAGLGEGKRQGQGSMWGSLQCLPLIILDLWQKLLPGKAACQPPTPARGTPHLCDSKCQYLRAQKKSPTAFKTLTLILRYNSHPVMSAPLCPKALQSNLIRNGRVSRAPFYFPVFPPPSLCKSSMVTLSSQIKRRGGSLMEAQLDPTDKCNQVIPYPPS